MNRTHDCGQGLAAHRLEQCMGADVYKQTAGLVELGPAFQRHRNAHELELDQQPFLPGGGKQGVGRMQRHGARAAYERFVRMDAAVGHSDDGLEDAAQGTIPHQARERPRAVAGIDVEKGRELGDHLHATRSGSAAYGEGASRQDDRRSPTARGGRATTRSPTPWRTTRLARRPATRSSRSD